MTTSPADPHHDVRILQRGAPADEARLAVILLHGRGGSAKDMMSLAGELDARDALFFAPQAEGHSWYPYSFLSPIERNEPALTSALAMLDRLLAHAAELGFAGSRAALLGFSQGACLALEFAARHAERRSRYAAVVALSGGVIGPPGTPREYAGSLAGTRVLLGCSDIDAHVPVDRVHESGDVLTALGATVDKRIYPGLGHTINGDEIAAVRSLLSTSI